MALNVKIGADIGSVRAELKVVEGAFSNVGAAAFDLQKSVDAAIKKIDANIDSMVSKALSGSADIKKSFGGIGAGFGSAFDKIRQQQNSVFSTGRGLDNFIGGLNKIPPAATKAGASLGKLPNVTNQSTLALTNLGRVVQDAPFGFLGIANNLNPLLESFQRLKATTGTTGGALKALGSSLLGAGGLGVALSIVSTGLILFGDRLFGIGKSAKETADKLKELIRPIGEIRDAAVGGAQEEISKIQALSNVILNQTRSYEERNRALKDLQTINKAYFGDLTLESSKLAILKDRVDEYTQALIASAVVKAFGDEIGKLAVELSKQERVFNQAGASLDKYKKEFAEASKDVSRDADGVLVSAKALDVSSKLGKATDAFNTQATVVGKLRNQMFILRQEITNAIDESLKFKPLSGTSKVKVEAEFVPLPLIKAPKNTTVDLSDVRIIPPALKATPTEGFFTDFLQPSIVEKRLSTVLNLFTLKISQTQNKLKGLLAGGIITADEIIATRQWEAAIENLNKIISTGFTDIFSSVGDTIAKSIQGDISGVQAIFTVLGDLISQIGKALVQYGIVKSGLDKILGAGGLAIPGSVAIGLGIAAIAIGQLVKGIQPKGFATGGLVFGPTLGLVGEGAGTNRSNPEVIAPLDQLRGIIQGAGGGGLVRVTGRLRGRDMILQNARETRSQRRRS